MTLGLSSFKWNALQADRAVRVPYIKSNLSQSAREELNAAVISPSGVVLGVRLLQRGEARIGLEHILARVAFIYVHRDAGARRSPAVQIKMSEAK
jgi:hypothetical protein